MGGERTDGILFRRARASVSRHTHRTDGDGRSRVRTDLSRGLRRCRVGNRRVGRFDFDRPHVNKPRV